MDSTTLPMRVGKLNFHNEIVPGHVFKAVCDCGVPTLVSKAEWGTVLGCLECEMARARKEGRYQQYTQKHPVR